MLFGVFGCKVLVLVMNYKKSRGYIGGGIRLSFKDVVCHRV